MTNAVVVQPAPAGAATPAAQEQLSGLWLLVALGVLVTTIVLCRIAWKHWANWLDEKLSASRHLRVGLMLTKIVSGTGATVSLAFIDLPAFRRPDFGAGDVALASLASCLGVVTLTLELFSYWHDDRWDQRQEQWSADLLAATEARNTSEKKAELLNQQWDLALKLGQVFLPVIGLKARRIQAAARSHPWGDQKPLDVIKSALNPDEQTLELVTAVHNYYAPRLPGNGKLRVAYFSLQNGHMRVVHSFDGVSPRCIQTPNEQRHRHLFCINPPNTTCLTVYVATRGSIEVLEDAATADAATDLPFRYYEEQQRHQIKCIVGIPLRRTDELAPIRHVLMIDSDTPRLFTKADLPELRLLQEHVAHRLLLETEMQSLLELTTN